MSNSGYKAAKELFVSDTKGSTITHINLISLIAFSSLCLYASLRTHLPYFPPKGPISLFAVQFITLVLPLLGAVTYAAQGYEALKWNVALGLPALAVCLRFDSKRRLVSESIPTSSPNPSKMEFPSEKLLKKVQNDRQKQVSVLQLPAVTTWRAHMMLMTVLGILAVDFPIFPRSLAKCEVFGVSLVRAFFAQYFQTNFFLDGSWCRILHFCTRRLFGVTINKGTRPPFETHRTQDIGEPEKDLSTSLTRISASDFGQIDRLSRST